MLSKQFQWTLVIALFLSPTLSWGQLIGDTYEYAEANKVAKWVITYSDAPGFAHKKASGEMSGICVDILKKFKEYVEVQKGIQITVSYRTKTQNDFTRFLEEVKTASGGVFGLSNTTITEARKSAYNFSPPYIANFGMILSNSSVPTLTDMSDIAIKFEGMTAVTVMNSTNEKRLLEIKKDYFPSLEIEYVPSFGQVMSIIVKDSKKFTNIDFTYYFEAIKKRKAVKRHPGGDEKAEDFGIIMPLSNDWSLLLAEFLNDEFLQSAEYKKIIIDNLGEEAMKFFEALNK